MALGLNNITSLYNALYTLANQLAGQQRIGGVQTNPLLSPTPNAIAPTAPDPLSAAITGSVKSAQAYANAVDKNGNVNQKKLANGGGDRQGIVTGYAA